jgi:Helix-turn-helix domain
VAAKRRRSEAGSGAATRLDDAGDRAGLIAAVPTTRVGVQPPAGWPAAASPKCGGTAARVLLGADRANRWQNDRAHGWQSKVDGAEDLPMPWKVRSVMDEHLRFVAAAEGGTLPMTAVCAAFGISRETGYRWLARYRAGSLEALSDGSRARHSQPTAIVAEVSAALRERRPHWSPKIAIHQIRRRPRVLVTPRPCHAFAAAAGALSPAERIRRAIRLRPCLLPVARSSAWIFGDPYVSREVAWTVRTFFMSILSSTAPADGGRERHAW